VVPDLICDDVLETIKYYVKDIHLYPVRDDFTIDMNFDDLDCDCVLYTIDYFGLEQDLVDWFDTKAVVIRDGVWFEKPMRKVKGKEIWFNSFRKIDWPNGLGSAVHSNIDLGRNRDFTVVANPIDWNYRRKNFKLLERLLLDISIDYTPTHPSLFPMLLKNRDEILSKLPIKTPRMWANKFGLPNDLYSELAFIPLDERFNEKSLTEIAACIRLHSIL
jgi:hypothetical protein